MIGFKALVPSLLLLRLVFSVPLTRKRDDLDSFITAEKSTALQGILDNIGPNGTLSQGATAGLVVASPSLVNPNYVYSWTRDSALTLKTLVDEFIDGDSSLQSHIEDYIKAQAVLQTVPNLSGDLYTGAGLGDPKYNLDSTSFKGSWGRPQRDGPALRAIALMSYVNWLVANGQSAEATDVVWPVIANDLSYVGEYWNQTGFDLWEETLGSSFFTIQNQYRALVQGSQLAKQLGKSCEGCDSQAPQVLCFMQSFWNGTSIVANINTAAARSGRDANTLLSAIAIFDINATCDDASFQPCNSKILASHKVLVDSFRGIYTINSGLGAGKAAAVGRYPEDVYYEGNPWYLCTLSAAEVLYDAAAQWRAQGQLTVDDTSYNFFKDIYPSVEKGTFSASDSSSPFTDITNAVCSYADGFVSIVQDRLPQNGSISEQFSRENGTPLSAYDLTWSFASFVTMAQRRSGKYPASWGSSNAAPAASTCAGTSAKGTYAAATSAGAADTTLCTVSVLFQVNASTVVGQNIFLTGNTSDLSYWKPVEAYPLNPDKYSSQRPLWYIAANLTAGNGIAYKYVRQEQDMSFTFESTNRTLAIPECGDEGTVVDDAFST